MYGGDSEQRGKDGSLEIPFLSYFQLPFVSFIIRLMGIPPSLIA